MKQTLFLFTMLSIALLSCKQARERADEINTLEITKEMKTENLNQDQLIQEFATIHDQFNKALNQFTATQLNEVPFEGSWTAGQVAEHIMKSNQGIIEQALNGKTATSERAFDEQVELVKNIFRSKEKMKSAAVIEPSAPPHQLDDILVTLKQQKAQQLEIVKHKDLKSLVSDLAFPPASDGLTRYEWLILMIEHMDRHRSQIENIYKELES